MKTSKAKPLPVMVAAPITEGPPTADNLVDAEFDAWLDSYIAETGAQRYLGNRLLNPEYRKHYEAEIEKLFGGAPVPTARRRRAQLVSRLKRKRSYGAPVRGGTGKQGRKTGLWSRRRTAKHYGPGPHASGTDQSVHGAWSTGSSTSAVSGKLTTEGGFTVDPTPPGQGHIPTSGFAVALPNHETHFPISKLNAHRIATHRAQSWASFKDIPNAHWGGWLDGDEVYLDVSIVVDSLEEAVELGRRYNQKALFNFDHFEEIRLDDDGASLAQFKEKHGQD